MYKYNLKCSAAERGPNIIWGAFVFVRHVSNCHILLFTIYGDQLGKASASEGRGAAFDSGSGVPV